MEIFCCMSSNAEDKKDANFATYGGDDTTVRGTDAAAGGNQGHSANDSSISAGGGESY